MGATGLFPLSMGAAIALQLGVAVAAAVALGRSRGRRALGVGVALFAPWLPWLAPERPPIVRFLLGMSGFLTLLHVIDLVRDRRALSTAARVWFVTTPFDTRAVRRIRPTVRPRLLLGGAVWAALSAGPLWQIASSPPPASASDYLVRWGLGLVGFYATVEAMVIVVLQGHLVCGLEPPPLHVHPALARSVQEFWGARWNLEVRRWLHLHAFRPFARRRRPLTGVLAAFAASTLLHVGIMLPTGGLAMAGLWAAFFLTQGVLVVVERRLGVATWPRGYAHAWTLFAFGVTSPMFVEPMLRVFPG